jgi:hypothetical protein
MALPTSGPISMSMVRTELGVPSQAPLSLSSSEAGTYATINPYSGNGTTPAGPDGISPYSISEWYGYNHSSSLFSSSYTKTTSSTVNYVLKSGIPPTTIVRSLNSTGTATDYINCINSASVTVSIAGIGSARISLVVNDRTATTTLINFSTLTTFSGNLAGRSGSFVAPRAHLIEITASALI